MGSDGSGRREYLTALGSTVAFGLAGCTTDGKDEGQVSESIQSQTDESITDGSSSGGISRPEWPSYVDDANRQDVFGHANDRGFEDLRGESDVTITVDSYYFEPTFVWVDPGTEIRWEFTAPGHNVTFDQQPAGSNLSGTAGGELDTVVDGESYSVTPEIEGIYTYQCGPHGGLGMRGYIAVGNSVRTTTATVGRRTRIVPTFTRGSGREGYRDLRGENEVTIQTDNNYFTPTLLWVDPETTISWDFTTPGHNVKFDRQPEEADLDGTSGGEFAVIDRDDTYSVSPSVSGIYTYYCGPHEGMGMKGAIAVGDDVPTVSTSFDRNSGNWPTYISEANERGYETAFGEDEVTIAVGNNYYDPTLLRIEPGTTVTWKFTAPGHNVNFNSQPVGTYLDGTPGGELDIVDRGDTYSTTLDAKGFYTYYCGSHAGLGMKGAIAVSERPRT